MITNPHDALFKYTFSQIPHAQSLLRAVLPAPLAQALDWNRLELTPGSFVDESLREAQSDLLFRIAGARSNVAVYVLAEHKSYPDRWVELQLLTYLARIWSQLHAETPAKRLPLIVPVVLYHGARAWNPPTLADQVRMPAELCPRERQRARAYVPALKWELVDVRRALIERPEAPLTPLAHLTLQLFRYGRTAKDLARRLRNWAAPIRRVARGPHGKEAITALFRYAFTVNDYIAVDELPKIWEAIGDDRTREAVMSLAERLIEKGRLEGIEKGRRQATVHLLERRLTLRFGALPAETLERIRRATPDELDTWAEGLLTSDTLEELDEVFRPR